MRFVASNDIGNQVVISGRNIRISSKGDVKIGESPLSRQTYTSDALLRSKYATGRRWADFDRLDFPRKSNVDDNERDQRYYQIGNIASLVGGGHPLRRSYVIGYLGWTLRCKSLRVAHYIITKTPYQHVFLKCPSDPKTLVPLYTVCSLLIRRRAQRLGAFEKINVWMWTSLWPDSQKQSSAVMMCRVFRKEPRE